MNCSEKMAATLATAVGIVFLVTSFVKLSHTAENSNCECGKPSPDVFSMRIVGGRRAAPHAYPWIVAIRKQKKMHCGGAVITNLHILSAGHCVKWDDYHNMDVLLGLDNMDHLKDVEERNIIKSHIHEHFTSTTVRDENDIAILTMDRPVEFNRRITPVCLPKKGQDFAGWSATIAGWGRIASSAAASKSLLRASLKILPYEECLKTKLKDHLVPTMLCSFRKGRDGCQGDSGGPLVVYDSSQKFIQVGVVSWGVGCADPRYPGVYTKVSDYVDWIKEHTADGFTCRE